MTEIEGYLGITKGLLGKDGKEWRSEEREDNGQWRRGDALIDDCSVYGCDTCTSLHNQARGM